MWLTPGTGMF